MGNFINIIESCKYKRDCYKCRSIDLEMSDLFNDNDMIHLPIIRVMQKRHLRKEHISHKIRNRMINVNNIYNNEINNR